MPRLSCLGIVAVLIVTAASAEQRSVDDILSLDGKALFAAARAAEASKFSVPDAIRIAERLSVERASTGGDYLNRQAFEPFFKYACDNADANELAELIQVYVTLGPENLERFTLLRPLAARWVDEELKNLRSGSLAAKLESADLAVPANLENAPSDLIDAWKAFKQATRAYDLQFERRFDGKMIAFQSNQHAFYKLVDELLLKKGDGLAEKLTNFGWSGGCGTGNELLSHPQSLTVFMALLNEHRLAEAVGAALYIKGYMPPMAHGIDLRIAFLEKCGLDWELIFAGAQLDSENHLSSRWHPADLQALAYYGSDRAASLVVEMAQRAEPQTREQYAASLAAFINRDNNNRVRGIDNPDVPCVSESQISPQTKSEIICVLQEFATPEASERVVQPALGAFWRVKRPEMIPTLRNLTKHRSPEVARSAAAILTSMGEQVSLPPPPEPVRFQILINGAPVNTDLSIGWSLYGASCDMVSAGGAKPNEEGTIEIKRECFLNAERKPNSIALEIGSAKSAREPFFYVSLSVPANLDSVTRVDVDLKPIELTIYGPPQALSDANQKATVHIERNKSEGESVAEHIYDRIARSFDAPTEQALSLMLQPGSYELEILFPGAERYTRIITVDGRNPSVDAQLRPGTDVHFLAVRPDDQRMRGYLTKPNSEMHLSYYQDKHDIFRGLPCGDYVLHIPGSAHSRDPVFIDAVNYAGREIPFTIPENSSPLVDLGTIRLDPAEK
jgi:ubiquitin